MKKLIAFVLAGLAAFLIGHDIKVGIPTPVPTMAETAAPTFDFPDTEPNDSERPVVEYPVVPGGIWDSVALYAALHRFPSLYDGFDFVSARFGPLQHPVIARTSFRRDGKIQWTREAVVYPAGTLAWVDAAGNVLIARCGNRLLLQTGYETPAITPDDDSPALATIAIPASQDDAPDIPASTPLFSLPIVASDTPAAIPTPSESFCGDCETFPVVFVPSRTPPVATPEPSTWILLVFGLSILIAIRARS